LQGEGQKDQLFGNIGEKIGQLFGNEKMESHGKDQAASGQSEVEAANPEQNPRRYTAAGSDATTHKDSSAVEDATTTSKTSAA
jgi:uncharacterized protein YjbJ (UPF0337 family)